MIILPGQSVEVQLQSTVREGVRRAQQQDRPVLVSVAEKSWPLDPVDLFNRTGYTDRYFWSQPAEGFTFVGLGIAQDIVAVEGSRFRQIATSWRQMLDGAILEGPRGLPGVGPLLCGGFRFDTERPETSEPTLWQGYPDGRMVLPKFLYTLDGSEAWLTCNLLVTPEIDADAAALELATRWDELQGEQRSRATRGSAQNNGHRTPVTLHELRPALDWQDEVAHTADDAARGIIEKAVLARAVRLEASEPFDIAHALRRLSESYRYCYIFAVGTGERCFVGATPERLARVRDRMMTTMSVAGTTRRGKTREEDLALGASLLASAKDRGEHAVTVRGILEALGPLCERIDLGNEPTLVKLGNVQHLYTPVAGQLSGEHTVLDVIERLHPTPAVGGTPRTLAMQIIREREGFDRGWYAGPVGWIDPQGDGEFAVALRSALIDGAQATLFAGCGIVADSVPEREYAESCLKLKPMLSALDAE